LGTVKKFERVEKIEGAPSDLEAEHALLGILLFDNSQIHAVSDIICPDAFYEPTHGRVYETIAAVVGAGRLADPLTVNHEMLADEGLAHLDGVHFLFGLVNASPAGPGARSYAKQIRELWQRRELIRLAESLAAQARGGETSTVLIEAAERDLLALQMTSNTVQLISASEAIDSVTDQLEQPNKSFGVPLGLYPIDHVTGGMMRGELWLLAGRPGAGKSAIASCAVLHVARHVQAPTGESLGVLEVCCEMTVEQLMRRHIADLAYEMHGADAPSYSAMRKRELTVDQKDIFYQSTQRLRDLKTLRLVYRAGLSIGNLRAMVRRQASKWSREGIRLGLISVDHVGLLKGSTPKWQGQRAQEQGEIAREMKDLAGELDIPILALVQLSRRVEERDNKRPQLSDLRDSGEWEQSADGVIGVYRDAYYAEREMAPKRRDEILLWEERKMSKQVDAILLKVREGQTQTVKLWADMARNAIRGSAPDIFMGRPSITAALNPDRQYPPSPSRFD
jgi:replicative DNA helicase